MNRQCIQKSEQLISTEGRIMSPYKGRMILLFNPKTLQRDCHFAEEFFSFERRSNNDQSQLMNKGTEKAFEGS